MEEKILLIGKLIQEGIEGEAKLKGRGFNKLYYRVF